MTDADILRFLRGAGLIEADATPAMEPLTGGVSSDIWKVDTATTQIAKLRSLIWATPRQATQQCAMSLVPHSATTPRLAVSQARTPTQ